MNMEYLIYFYSVFLSSVSWFSAYESYSSFVRFIPKYFIVLEDFVNEMFP